MTKSHEQLYEEILNHGIDLSPEQSDFIEVWSDTDAHTEDQTKQLEAVYEEIFNKRRKR